MNYHNIKHDDMLNGEGLRVTLFVSGCSHHCPHCQNPTTWDPDSGISFNSEALEELFSQLDKPYIDGITLSGGDPLMPCNRIVIMSLMLAIRGKYGSTKTIWVYTGYKYEEIDEEILKPIDVLVDGEFMIDKLSPDKEWVGSSNQRVIDVQKSLKLGQVVPHRYN